MENNDLRDIISRFDYFVKDVNFSSLPQQGSQQYRDLLMQTANDSVFMEGRYSIPTEYMLEIFREDEAWEVVQDLQLINDLTDEQRIRLRFYMDLKDLCFPLFAGEKINWTEQPWGMDSDSDSADNAQLFAFITQCQWPHLSAAILYDLQRQSWADVQFYSSVARTECSQILFYGMNSKWEKRDKTEEDIQALKAAVDECANKFWFVENHLHVGRQLGFDHLDQSVYDAVDTYIDRTYRHQQVNFAFEFAAWIRQHMTIGEPHPDKQRVDAMWTVMQQLMQKHGVQSPDLSYTWNILTLDVLGMSMFSKEEMEDDSAHNLWTDDRKDLK